MVIHTTGRNTTIFILNPIASNMMIQQMLSISNEVMIEWASNPNHRNKRDTIRRVCNRVESY